MRRFGSAAIPYVVRSTIGLLSDSYTLFVSSLSTSLSPATWLLTAGLISYLPREQYTTVVLAFSMPGLLYPVTAVSLHCKFTNQRRTANVTKLESALTQRLKTLREFCTKNLRDDLGDHTCIIIIIIIIIIIMIIIIIIIINTLFNIRKLSKCSHCDNVGLKIMSSVYLCPKSITPVSP